MTAVVNFINYNNYDKKTGLRGKIIQGSAKLDSTFASVSDIWSISTPKDKSSCLYDLV